MYVDSSQIARFLCSCLYHVNCVLFWLLVPPCVVYLSIGLSASITCFVSLTAKQTFYQSALRSLCAVGVLCFIKSAADCQWSDVSLQGQTALILASYNGHLPVAEALIGAKADVNVRDVSSFCMRLLFNDSRALAKQKRLCLSCWPRIHLIWARNRFILIHFTHQQVHGPFFAWALLTMCSP